MHRLLAGICLLSACAGPRGESFGFDPPQTTPYDHLPALREQYLKAYRAAWNRQVSEVTEEWLELKLKGEDPPSTGSFVTCCEATPNVTTGWYRGMDAGARFIARIAVQVERPAEVLEKFRRLKKDIDEHPVTDWYISDAYTPSLLVEVPEQEGTVIRSYRDSTRTKLYQVRQVRNGKNHGRCETYDVNGALRGVETWVDDAREGLEIHYSDTGEVSGWTTYHRDQRQGPSVFFDDAGPMSFQRWEADRLDGRCLTYREGGAQVAVYEAGERTRDAFVPASDLPEEERPSTLNRLREAYRR
jgi:hypothetical protein